MLQCDKHLLRDEVEHRTLSICAHNPDPNLKAEQLKKLLATVDSPEIRFFQKVLYYVISWISTEFPPFRLDIFININRGQSDLNRVPDAKLKYWAQTNSAQDEARALLSDSKIAKYGVARIQQRDNSYPSNIDFITPLVAELLSGADLQNLVPKKRPRGQTKAKQQNESDSAAKKRLSGSG